MSRSTWTLEKFRLSLACRILECIEWPGNDKPEYEMILNRTWKKQAAITKELNLTHDMQMLKI